MNRKGFLKSIAMLAVAPKIISEMEFKPPIVQPMVTKGLVSDLQLLTPQFYKVMAEKYGDTDFTFLMNEIGKHKPNTNQYFWFEKRNSES